MKIRDREWQRVLAYIEEHSQFASPLVPLAKILVDDFGWSASAARRRANSILKELKGSKLVLCEYDKRGTPKSVKFLSEKETEPAQPIPQKETEKIEPAFPVPEPTRRLPKGINPETLGADPEGVGDHNEERFFIIAGNLMRVLRRLFPAFKEAEVTRSGRHLPQRGEVDIADHSGEDVGIRVRVEPDGGSRVRGRIIYDVKSSKWFADERNRNIRFGRREIITEVLLKRAVLVNYKRRDREIVAEILSDLKEIGIGFINPEAALKFFK